MVPAIAGVCARLRSYADVPRPVDDGCVPCQLGAAYEPARHLERFFGRARLLEQHSSDRASDRPRTPIDRKRPGRDEQAETLGEVGKLEEVDVRGEDDELLPAPAEDLIARAQRTAQPVTDVHEQAVAGGVAVRVVDRLETVEVEEAESGRASAAPHPRLLGRKRLRERVTVRRICERVDAGT